MSESPHSEPSAPSPDATEPAAKRGLSVSIPELILIGILTLLVVIAYSSWYRTGRTRADVSRTKADLRAVATAVESYMIDWMTYPMCGLAEGPDRVMPNGIVFPSGTNTVHSHLPVGSGARRMFTFGVPTNFSVPHHLTTPLAYIKEFPMDPFADTPGATFGYFRTLETVGPRAANRFSSRGLNIWFGRGWILWSHGPDRDENDPNGPSDIGGNVENIYDGTISQPSVTLIDYYYNATNGTYSEGDIIRVRH